MSKIDCKIIMDLLPLYHDNVVSEETKKEVEEHLKTCDGCKKEYDELSEELPKVNLSSTKDKFAKMLKKQKIKRILSMLVVVFATCGATLFCGYTLTQMPIKKVPSSEIEVLKAYVVDTDYGENVFVLYNTPVYNGQSSAKVSSNNNAYSITKKVPLLSSKQDEYTNFELVSHFLVEDADEIYFNDNLIWSEATNKNDIVPDYVYEYFSIENSYFNYSQGIIGVGTDEDNMTYWDLDGNVIKN